LKAGAWNAVQLTMADDGMRLELHGTVVYERNLLAKDDRTFGLFHYKDRDGCPGSQRRADG
jgi:hypothetical protein